MKIIFYIVLFLAISESFCLLKTKAKKSKQQLLPIPTNLDCLLFFIIINLKEFPAAILEEINQYLTLYSKPLIEKNELLDQTATSAIEEILSHNTFGQHSQIEEWQSKVPNDIFTEMCFNVNVTNSNYYSKELSSKTQKVMYDTKMSVGTIVKSPIAPTPQMFAKNIIEALESEHLLLTLDQYASCGIAVKEMDQTKFPNEYLVVMHFIKPKAGAQQQPLVFTSCKDAKSKGVTDENIEITVNGVKHSVKCLNEQDGGWTLIHTENKDYGEGGIVSINDLGINYDQIFFKAGEKMQGNYYYVNTNNWVSKGFNFIFNSLKFGSTWYTVDNWTPATETNWRTVGTFKNLISGFTEFPFSDVKSLAQAQTCQFESKFYQNFCSTSFILKKLGGERIVGLSDIEYLSQPASQDYKGNTIYYDFQIYVR